METWSLPRIDRSQMSDSTEIIGYHYTWQNVLFEFSFIYSLISPLLLAQRNFCARFLLCVCCSFPFFLSLFVQSILLLGLFPLLLYLFCSLSYKSSRRLVIVADSPCLRRRVERKGMVMPMWTTSTFRNLPSISLSRLCQYDATFLSLAIPIIYVDSSVHRFEISLIDALLVFSLGNLGGWGFSNLQTSYSLLQIMIKLFLLKLIHFQYMWFFKPRI